MPYDGKLLARARAKLDAVRAGNEAEHQRRVLEVCGRVPEIQRIDLRMRAQMAELVRLTVSRRSDLGERLAELKDENLDLQMRKAELLTENGYPTDYLDELYSCKKCRDTGVFEGRPCVCLDRLYNAELTQELGTLMRRGDESFELFDLSLYDDRPMGGVVPREVMSRVLEGCRTFAANFPNVSSNLLFQGAPGLGKTYLSACIARSVAAKGLSVCYDSASAALDCFEKQKFLRDTPEGEEAAARVRRMLDCDLMILDDLGTEMVTPMSLSSLYTLINTRLVNGKRMVISTNLRDAELQKTYTPQICSRLSGEFLRLPFVGRDIRLIRKENRKG